jgi:hypothetical protein
MRIISQPYHECPRFNRCNVNNCPLSFSYPLFVDYEDRDPKCTLEKPVRVRIGSKYPRLKYQGMTAKEYSGTKRYESLSTEEKERLAEIGIQSLKNQFCSSSQKQLSSIDMNVSASDYYPAEKPSIRAETCSEQRPQHICVELLKTESGAITTPPFPIIERSG